MFSKAARAKAHSPIVAGEALALAGAALICGSAMAAEPPQPMPQPPSVLFGDLFVQVQMSGLFPDSKTFPDATPKRPPAEIMAAYRADRPRSQAALRAFVDRNFTLPETVAAVPHAVRPQLSLKAHIASLWPVLTRPPVHPAPGSSQLPLNHPYVVPGGRFREIYYWDSYFTMLGLVRDGHRDLVRSMTEDFADMIDRYGHVPNGARTYYLSRSQPPFFYLMTGLTADDQVAGYARYLPALKREYRFWMKGEAEVQPGHAYAHVVRMPDGAVLNRYWDALAKPRDEAYAEDVRTAEKSGRPAPEVWRDLRSASESGWDFSSRWLADGRTLSTIQTTSITPVDLNSLLFGLEHAIAQGCDRAGDRACAREFDGRAEARKAAMDHYLWDPASSTYLDYQWREGRRLDHPSAAMAYPLFTGAASAEQARGVAAAIRRTLLAPGGVRTTAVRTGQQWDAPNGWAPLQWVAVQGLSAYGQGALADDIARRWLTTVCRAYSETGKLVEKYDIETARPGGGGEYPLQDGFGWTNGVTRALIARSPAFEGFGDCGASVSAPRKPVSAPALAD